LGKIFERQILTTESQLFTIIVKELMINIKFFLTNVFDRCIKELTINDNKFAFTMKGEKYGY
jgi:hypothetical protein